MPPLTLAGPHSPPSHTAPSSGHTLGMALTDVPPTLLPSPWPAPSPSQTPHSFSLPSAVTLVSDAPKQACLLPSEQTRYSLPSGAPAFQSHQHGTNKNKPEKPENNIYANCNAHPKANKPLLLRKEGPSPAGPCWTSGCPWACSVPTSGAQRWEVAVLVWPVPAPSPVPRLPATLSCLLPLSCLLTLIWRRSCFLVLYCVTATCQVTLLRLAFSFVLFGQLFSLGWGQPSWRFLCRVEGSAPGNSLHGVKGTGSLRT